LVRERRDVAENITSEKPQVEKVTSKPLDLRGSGGDLDESGKRKKRAKNQVMSLLSKEGELSETQLGKLIKGRGRVG